RLSPAPHLTHAIRCPSGDHAGSKLKPNGPTVVRPDPSAAMTLIDVQGPQETKAILDWTVAPSARAIGPSSGPCGAVASSRAHADWRLANTTRDTARMRRIRNLEVWTERRRVATPMPRTKRHMCAAASAAAPH